MAEKKKLSPAARKIFFCFSNRILFAKKLRLADPTRKCITYWDPDPGTPDPKRCSVNVKIGIFTPP